MGDKRVKMVSGAFATGSGGNGPLFAEMVVDAGWIGRVEALIGLCAAHSLTEVRTLGSPSWGPGPAAEGLRLQCGELVVTSSGGVWFSDYPKNCDYKIESRGCDLEKIKVAFEGAADGDVVFLSEHDGSKAAYEEEMVGLVVS